MRRTQRKNGDSSGNKLAFVYVNSMSLMGSCGRPADSRSGTISLLLGYRYVWRMFHKDSKTGEDVVGVFLFCFVFLHAKNLEEELRECCFILGSSSKTSDVKKKKSCSAALFKMLAVLSGSSGTGFSEVQHFR